MANKAIDIDLFIDILETDFEKWDAPVSGFIQAGHRTPFETLLSAVLSTRTKDEVTTNAVSRLFPVARTPEGILELTEDELGKLIYPVGFFTTKAVNILKISKILLEKFEGTVPDEMDGLMSLPGVGRKIANLVLSQVFGKDAICVDTHVHRISNRIAYVNTKTPEQTEKALCKKLPLKYWRRFNILLVGFGQTICRPVSPRCNQCPVKKMCPGCVG